MASVGTSRAARHRGLKNGLFGHFAGRVSSGPLENASSGRVSLKNTRNKCLDKNLKVRVKTIGPKLQVVSKEMPSRIFYFLIWPNLVVTTLS